MRLHLLVHPWATYVGPERHSESDNAFQRFGRLKFSKMAAGRHLEFDPTGNGAVGSAIPNTPP